jgi:hypothetical protein
VISPPGIIRCERLETMRGSAEPDEEPVQPAKLGDGRWPTN